MRKSEKKGPNFLGRHGPILRLTFSEWFLLFGFYEIFRILGLFFDLTGLQDPCAKYTLCNGASFSGRGWEGCRWAMSGNFVTWLKVGGLTLILVQMLIQWQDVILFVSDMRKKTSPWLFSQRLQMWDLRIQNSFVLSYIWSNFSSSFSWGRTEKAEDRSVRQSWTNCVNIFWINQLKVNFDNHDLLLGRWLLLLCSWLPPSEPEAAWTDGKVSWGQQWCKATCNTNLRPYHTKYATKRLIHVSCY